MPSLQRAEARFGTKLTIIEGGSGVFTGSLQDPDQGPFPPSQLTSPRSLLRVNPDLPLKAGMVIKTPDGAVYMMGSHAAAESWQGTLFRNFRLFEASGQYTWQTRGKKIDPVTKLPMDTAPVDKGLIWGSYEPSPEMFDRQLASSFEMARFITTADVQRDDIVDGRKVSRVDIELGLRVATLG